MEGLEDEEDRSGNPSSGQHGENKKTGHKGGLYFEIIQAWLANWICE